MEIKIRTKIKYGLLSNHLFQSAQKYGGWRDLRVTINFKKTILQLSHGIKNIYRSKLQQEHTYLQNGFLELLFLKIKKLVVYLVCMSLLWISREDKTKRILFIRNKFVFLFVDSLLVHKCKFVRKNSSSKCWLCWLVDAKKFYGYNAVTPLNLYLYKSSVLGLWHLESTVNTY